MRKKMNVAQLLMSGMSVANMELAFIKKAVSLTSIDMQNLTGSISKHEERKLVKFVIEHREPLMLLDLVKPTSSSREMIIDLFGRAMIDISVGEDNKLFVGFERAKVLDDLDVDLGHFLSGEPIAELI